MTGQDSGAADPATSQSPRRETSNTGAASDSSAGAGLVSRRARQLGLSAPLDRAGRLADREQHGRLLTSPARWRGGRLPRRRAGEHGRQLRHPCLFIACRRLRADCRRGRRPCRPAQPDGDRQRHQSGSRRALPARAAGVARAGGARRLLRDRVPLRRRRPVLQPGAGRVDSGAGAPRAAHGRERAVQLDVHGHATAGLCHARAAAVPGAGGRHALRRDHDRVRRFGGADAGRCQSCRCLCGSYRTGWRIRCGKC